MNELATASAASLWPAQRMVLEIYFPNQAIVLQGEAPDKFYAIESGTVSIEIYLGCGQRPPS